MALPLEAISDGAALIDLGSGQFRRLRADWIPIALWVAGSWIADASLLMLGWLAWSSFEFRTTHAGMNAILLLALPLGLLACIGLGQYTGRQLRRRRPGEEAASMGSVIGAMLAILGFILALTFSMVVGRFGERKQLLLQEANAIGTASLRAEFLPPEARRQAQRMLADYVDLRLQIGREPQRVAELIASSESLQDRLWAHALQHAPQIKSQPLAALYFSALNEVFDVHSVRYNTGIVFRLHPAIWSVLIGITVVAMFAVGLEFGLTGSGGILPAILLVSMISLLLLFLQDLDRPIRGSWIRITQEPMEALGRKIKGSAKLLP